MSNQNINLLNKVRSLEKELQEIKLTLLFQLSKKKLKSLYPQKKLFSTIRDLRKNIWQERYAKKIKDLS